MKQDPRRFANINSPGGEPAPGDLAAVGAPIEQAHPAAVTTLVGIETVYLLSMRRLRGAAAPAS